MEAQSEKILKNQITLRYMLHPVGSLILSTYIIGLASAISTIAIIRAAMITKSRIARGGTKNDLLFILKPHRTPNNGPKMQKIQKHKRIIAVSMSESLNAAKTMRPHRIPMTKVHLHTLIYNSKRPKNFSILGIFLINKFSSSWYFSSYLSKFIIEIILLHSISLLKCKTLSRNF